MTSLEEVLAQCEELFKLVQRTEVVAGRLGFLYFFPPHRANQILRQMFPEDFAHLSQLFEIQAEELYRLHGEVNYEQGHVVYEHGGESEALAFALMTLNRTREVFDKLIAELKRIKAILCKHAKVYMDNRLAWIGPDEGIPNDDDQKIHDPTLTAQMESWAVGFPMNRARLLSGETAVQVYYSTFAVPDGDWQLEHLRLEDRVLETAETDTGFQAEVDAELQAIIDGGVMEEILSAMRNGEEQEDEKSSEDERVIKKAKIAHDEDLREDGEEQKDEESREDERVVDKAKRSHEEQRDEESSEGERVVKKAKIAHDEDPLTDAELLEDNEEDEDFGDEEDENKQTE